MDSVIAPVLQVKFRFMGCLVKPNALVSCNRSSLSSQLIILLFLRNSHIIFSVFSRTFRKVLQPIKKIFRKFLEILQKKHPWRIFILIKLQAYRSCHRKCFVKEVFLEISQKNTCARDAILVKLQD